MKALHRGVIYENPLPQLRSRQSIFPSLLQLPDGDILASHAIGEAFESVDARSYLSISRDGGRSFALLGPMFTEKEALPHHSESCKLTLLPDGRLCALGYAYDRQNPSLPLGNPETGGLLEDLVFISYSSDDGRHWSPWQSIDCAWGPHVEASAPLTLLCDGSWVSPITGFPDWEGNLTGRLCGRLLRSDDQGASWSDDVLCMAFPGDEITCYEQRLCQLDSGALVCIGWNENVVTGQRLSNHFTLSTDGGRSFSAPRSTGVMGQASSVCALGGEKLLALHALRRDTDAPGIYAHIVDLSKERWDIQEEYLLWAPDAPVRRDKSMAEIFAFLRFGQPSAIRLADGNALCCFWLQEDGQYKTVSVLLEL